MSTTTLLKQGTIVTGEKTFTGDVLVNENKIAEIAPSISKSADLEINCEGKLVLPGMIDTHVHFRDPGFTHKADATSESIAALSGGVTTVCDMPNTNPQTLTVALVKEKQKLYSEKCFCNFGIAIGAAKDNLEELKKADDDPTIPFIKAFLAESTGEMTLAERHYLEPIFEQTKKIIVAHAEDEGRRLERLQLFSEGKLPGAEGVLKDDPYQHALIRDNLVAALGTKNAVSLAKEYQHRLHIAHMSAEEELSYLKEGIAAGLVTGETCPHYLWFNREDIKEHAGYRIMNPALKQEKDSKALWEALRSGLITQIVTDHAPHLPEEKDQPYGKLPAGVPGVEFALPLLLHAVTEEKLTLNHVVQLTSENAAKNFGIRNKGFLKEGYDADIVVIDPTKELSITNDIVRSKCGWTPYAGMTLKGGIVEKTFVNGELLFDQGEMVSRKKGKSIAVEQP